MLHTAVASAGPAAKEKTCTAVGVKAESNSNAPASHAGPPAFTPLPGGLQPLLGVDVDEYLPIPPEMAATAGGHAYHRWAEVLRPTTAAPLLHYDDRYWVGEPAVAVNRVGDGTAVTLGCWFTEQPLPPAVWSVLGLDELTVPFAVPAGVEVNAMRYADGRDGYQLLNHNRRTVDVTVPFAPQVVGNGQVHGRTIRLPGLGVAFVSVR